MDVPKSEEASLLSYATSVIFKMNPNNPTDHWIGLGYDRREVRLG